jgi:putative DNA modification/repair radical SAM protein
MEQVIEVARVLREERDFRGYIHLKMIPDASDDLIARAGRYADRVSIDIELPTVASLTRLAPEKNVGGIRKSMARLRMHIDEAGSDGDAKGRRRARTFAPAGQSTQMIVGADDSSDRSIIETSANLYGSYRLKRVYYSAFSPIPDAASTLPLKAPPLIRVHRLYQADWLMRFYGFMPEEIPTVASGMLALDIDPKLAWALQHRDRFPVDINRADKELLLRVPGLGVKAVRRILASRRVRTLRVDDLARLRVAIKQVLPFIVVPGHRGNRLLDSMGLERNVRPAAEQLPLFAPPQLRVEAVPVRPAAG